MKNLPKQYRSLYIFYCFVPLFLLNSCDKEDDNVCENPMLGFAFYPDVFMSPDPSNYITHYDSEVMLLHFGDNVPWEYLSECPDLSCADENLQGLLQDLSLRVASHQGKVYLSVSPLNNDRNAPSLDWNGAPPPDTSFSDPELRNLYKKWVQYLADLFEPDFISQGVEINMFALANPSDFPNLLSLMQEFKDEIPKVVGPSVQWEFY